MRYLIRNSRKTKMKETVDPFLERGVGCVGGDTNRILTRSIRVSHLHDDTLAVRVGGGERVS